MEDPTVDIRGNVELHPGAMVQNDVWLNAIEGGKIYILEGANIGRRSIISSAKSIVIGKDVLIAPNVFIADVSHEYRDVTKPISRQGTTEPRDITIGDGSWLGINSVVLASVGKGCVVGANTVVTKDIPDFCVVVGQPGRIIKRYKTLYHAWCDET